MNVALTANLHEKMGVLLTEINYFLQVVKTLCYTTKLVSAIQADRGNDDLANKFALFSTKMSQTRANLRLFEDLPLIQHSMNYGWGENEPDGMMAALGVITNFVDHLYYSADKICWLIQQKIINVSNNKKWETINAVLWVTSVYLNLMK